MGEPAVYRTKDDLDQAVTKVTKSRDAQHQMIESGKRDTRMLEAVIMDMDGTLLDSEPIHAQSFQGFLDELGVNGKLSVEDDIVGYDLETICRNCIDRFDIDIPAEEYIRMQHDFTYRLFGEVDLVETQGLTPFLRDLKAHGVRTAVASATHSEIVGRILERLDIMQYIDAVCGVDTVAKTKPAPDLFLKAAEVLGADPDNCIVIEDSPAGIKAAGAAGMRSIAISCHTGVPDEAANADLVVQDFMPLKYETLLHMTEDGDPLCE